MEANSELPHAASRSHWRLGLPGAPGEGSLLQMSSFDVNLGSASRSSGGCWFKDRPCLIGAASCEAQGRRRSCLGKGRPPFGTIAPAFIVRIVQAQIFFVQLRYQRIEGPTEHRVPAADLREFPGGRRQSENPG